MSVGDIKSIMARTLIVVRRSEHYGGANQIVRITAQHAIGPSHHHYSLHAHKSLRSRTHPKPSTSHSLGPRSVSQQHSSCRLLGCACCCRRKAFSHTRIIIVNELYILRQRKPRASIRLGDRLQDLGHHLVPITLRLDLLDRLEDVEARLELLELLVLLLHPLLDACHSTQTHRRDRSVSGTPHGEEVRWAAL